MLRFLRIVLPAIALSSVAQADDSRGRVGADLKESAADFVRLFDQTCFQNRDRLETLRLIAKERKWTEYPGPFPYKHDGSTALIVWGFQENDVTYQIGLSVFDQSAPAVTCGLISFALDKAVLASLMRDRLGMRIAKTAMVGEQDITLLEFGDDPDLLISCATATPKPVLIGQCALVRPVRKHGFRTSPSQSSSDAEPVFSESMVHVAGGN